MKVMLLGFVLWSCHPAYSQTSRAYKTGEIEIWPKQYIGQNFLVSGHARFLHHIPELIKLAPKDGGAETLSGAGVVVGVWDGGLVQAAHQDFRTGQVLHSDPKHQPSSPLTLSNHATHVAGTIAGSGLGLEAAKGMAHGASIWSFDSTNDIEEMKDLVQAGKTINVSNHSYAAVVGWTMCPELFPVQGKKDRLFWAWNGPLGYPEDDYFGKYSKESADIDKFALDNPIWTQVNSAGNTLDPILDPYTAQKEVVSNSDYYWAVNYDLSFNGEHFFRICSGAKKSAPRKSNRAKKGGFDSIPGGSSVAKNVITVGAMVDPDPQNAFDPVAGTFRPIPLKDIKATIFSSWGPTDDGRIKPDIIANGQAVVATAIPKKCNQSPRCKPSDATSDNKNYVQMGGTSMAAPVVTGTLALLNELSMRVRNGRSLRSDEAKALLIHTARSPHQGPSYKIGWGSIQADEAGILLKSANAGEHFQLITIERSKSKELKLERVDARPGRITLVWLDEPGTLVTGLDNDQIMLVNDIDMQLVPPSGDLTKAVLPWTLDHKHPENKPKRGRNIRDNVERIDVPAELDENGTWTLKIEASAWKNVKTIDAALGIWGFRLDDQ